MLIRSIPLLHVASAARSLAFYRDGLGFAVEFAVPADASDPCYLGLERDGARLHLSSHADDAVPGGVAYILADEIDRLHDEILPLGAAITLHPFNQSWGMREMYVRDPDGNAIRFAAPVS